MTEQFPEPIKAKCQRCHYEWTTLSKAYSVSCPSCMTKVKIRKYIFVEEKKEN
jgi:Zn finger protein HypA/HybF involved in hydrogenase expression